VAAVADVVADQRTPCLNPSGFFDDATGGSPSGVRSYNGSTVGHQKNTFARKPIAGERAPLPRPQTTGILVATGASPFPHPLPEQGS